MNLGLKTLDVVYLNNVIENHMPFMKPEAFWLKIHKAFELYEKMADAGSIRSYGVASWASLRLPK